VQESDNNPNPTENFANNNDEEEVEEEIEEEGEEEIKENIEENIEDRDNEPEVKVTRSGRVYRAPAKLNLRQCHLHTQGYSKEEYSIETGRVIAEYINNFSHIKINKLHKRHSFVETFSLNKGLQNFGQKGHDAAYNEMKQLHDRGIFIPVDISTLTQHEKKRAMDSLIFLTEKRERQNMRKWQHSTNLHQ
jgi:hypothetical protein